MSRTCDRCGRPRPERADRFVIVVEDHTDSSAAYDRWFLCRECWQTEQARLRREVTA